MVEELRELGKVKLVQLQPNGLIIETPAGNIYDASRRMEVDRLLITTKGIEATTQEGERVLDIHHIDHPAKAYDNSDLICIGFTSHYEAMRARFGDHMEDGIAGENIIIDCQEEIWPDDLGERVMFENKATGRQVWLNVVSFAAPCKEFAHFAAQSLDKQLPAETLKEALRFLNNGRRGYLLVPSDGQEPAEVRPGDRVYLLRARS